MYVLSTGCQWRYLPKDLPPKSTVHDYLTRWNYDGTLERIHHTLYVQCREAAGRAASPTACVIDSQTFESDFKAGLTAWPPKTFATILLSYRRRLSRAQPLGHESANWLLTLL